MTRCAFKYVIYATALVVSACGSVTVTKMAEAPARPADCTLEFVQTEPSELTATDSKWQVLGYVQLSDVGSQDPFSEAVKTTVRPKACELGGEAVSLSSGVNSSSGLGASIVSYAVLRPKPAGEAAPTTF